MSMKKAMTLIAIAVAALLAACGGGQATVADSEVDLSSLSLELDVDTVAGIMESDQVLLLDVREQWEYDAGHIPGVTLLPMGEIPASLDQIPTDKEVVVTCRTGNRSGQVVEFLRDQGFENVHNMLGGIVAWEEAGLPVER